MHFDSQRLEPSCAVQPHDPRDSGESWSGRRRRSAAVRLPKSDAEEEVTSVEANDDEPCHRFDGTA